MSICLTETKWHQEPSALHYVTEKLLGIAKILLMCAQKYASMRLLSRVQQGSTSF